MVSSSPAAISRMLTRRTLPPVPTFGSRGGRRPLMLWGLSVEGRVGGTTLHAPIYRFYGVMVVANASVVRLFVSPLVCMKTDLNALPLFASPM
jgi:hypothetical protein